MPSAPAVSAFARAARGSIPFLIVVFPFGLLFGVAATEAGLDVLAVLGFSVLVIAGAAQFAAVQLLVENAPTLVVILTALAVNLRTAMYSAALVPHLGQAPLRTRALAAYVLVDQIFVASVAEYARKPGMSLGEKVGFYFGTAAPIIPVWFAGTVTGAVVGQSIPPEFALDFAVPITFLAVIAPMLRTLAHVTTAVVAVAAALMLSPLPYNSGLLVAAGLAMMAGAEVERRATRGPART